MELNGRASLPMLPRYGASARTVRVLTITKFGSAANSVMGHDG